MAVDVDETKQLLTLPGEKVLMKDSYPQQLRVT